MKDLLNQHRYFFVPYLIFLVVTGGALLLIKRGDEVIFIDSHHTPFFDAFFFYVTKLAEAPAFIMVLLLILFGGFGNGIIVALAYGVVAGVVQFLKLVVFEDQIRPALYFSNAVPLHYVNGLDNALYHSFPSGHTAIAFTLGLSLCFVTRNKVASFFFFILALLVGLSRIYLLQHFMRDVFAGSLIGVFITTWLFHYIRNSNRYQKIAWRDKRIFIND